MKLHECMMSISDDLTSESIKLYNMLFPEFIQFGIGKENRRNDRNNNEIARVLREFVVQSNDNTSVYKQAIAALDSDPEDIFSDCSALLIGGHETTFMSFTSALYSLKKHPECMKLLMRDINDNISEGGKISPEQFLKDFDPHKLDEMEYLTMVIKEV